MQYVPEQIYVMFDREHFNLFAQLAESCNDFLLRSMVGKFRKDDDSHYLPLSKTEFCMLILQIKVLDRKSPLIKRLTELGQNQYPEFMNLLDRVEMQAKRYNLLTH